MFWEIAQCFKESGPQREARQRQWQWWCTGEVIATNAYLPAENLNR